VSSDRKYGGLLVCEFILSFCTGLNLFCGLEYTIYTDGTWIEMLKAKKTHNASAAESPFTSKVASKQQQQPRDMCGSSLKHTAVRIDQYLLNGVYVCPKGKMMGR